MSAFQTSAGVSSPASAFLLALVWAVPVSVVCSVAFLLNWGR